MHSLQTLSRRASQLRSPVRFRPVLHLLAGDLLGTAAEEMTEFEECVSFGPRTQPRQMPSAASWMAARLERIASAAWAEAMAGRPILVGAPLAALIDPQTATVCDTAIQRTTLCQQEFCLMFSDSACCSAEGDLTGHIARLRKHGFRVGLDLRHSWQMPMSEALCLMIDTIRIDADLLENSQVLQEKSSNAHASGILVVADNASWRDGETLSAAGITGAVSPQTDA